MTYVIAQPCVDVKDKSCIEECPVDCIYEGARSLYIQPDECVDCGACEPVCPVEAIYYEDDIPSQWKDSSKINTEFFVELGSPGGAAKVGLTNSDHPIVAALPPKEYFKLSLPYLGSCANHCRIFRGMRSLHMQKKRGDIKKE